MHGRMTNDDGLPEKGLVTIPGDSMAVSMGMPSTCLCVCFPIFNGLLIGGSKTSLNNMSSSVGIMKFLMYGNIKHVPKHQPDWFSCIPGIGLYIFMVSGSIFSYIQWMCQCFSLYSI